MEKRMSGPEYVSALSALGLSHEQAAAWLDCGRSTSFRWVKTGPIGPAARAIRMRLALEGLGDDVRRAVTQLRAAAETLGEGGDFTQGKDCLYVAHDLERHADVIAAIGADQ